MSELCYSLLSSREKEAEIQKRARHLAKATRAMASAKVRDSLESIYHIYFQDYV